MMIGLSDLVNVILHLDKHIAWLFGHYSLWVYLILFLTIFCETGLVVTPFLPGDSLLFAIGAFAATGSINIILVITLLCLAAILGDTANYWIGHLAGKQVYKKKTGFINKEYLERTRVFYEKHGGKTIVVGRFLPVIRTFAPFVAGVGEMSYGKFLVYNMVGGIAWVLIFLLGGYFFGSIPVVKQNFGWVILTIMALSTLPLILEYLRHLWVRKALPRKKGKGGLSGSR